MELKNMIELVVQGGALVLLAFVLFYVFRKLVPNIMADNQRANQTLLDDLRQTRLESNEQTRLRDERSAAARAAFSIALKEQADRHREDRATWFTKMDKMSNDHAKRLEVMHKECKLDLSNAQLAYRQELSDMHKEFKAKLQSVCRFSEKGN